MCTHSEGATVWPNSCVELEKKKNPDVQISAVHQLLFTNASNSSSLSSSGVVWLEVFTFWLIDLFAITCYIQVLEEVSSQLLRFWIKKNLWLWNRFVSVPSNSYKLQLPLRCINNQYMCSPEIPAAVVTTKFHGKSFFFLVFFVIIHFAFFY